MVRSLARRQFSQHSNLFHLYQLMIVDNDFLIVYTKYTNWLFPVHFRFTCDDTPLHQQSTHELSGALKVPDGQVTLNFGAVTNNTASGVAN